MYTTTPTASTSVLGPGTFYLFYQFFLRNSQKNIAFKNTGVQSGHILKSNDIKNKSMFAEHLDIYSTLFSCHSSISLNKKSIFFYVLTYAKSTHQTSAIKDFLIS